MIVSSLDEQPESLAEFLRGMLRGATHDLSSRPARPGRVDPEAQGHLPSAALPPVRLVTNAALGHDYLVIVLHHHERIDGRGYPHGLRGDEIPLDARILAVADSYDAMTSDRGYRPGMPPTKAVAILNDGAGTQWDCSVIKAFLHDK